MDKIDEVLGVPIQIYGGGVGWGSNILKIECRNSISCAPSKTAPENYGYTCWGKIDKAAEELQVFN